MVHLLPSMTVHFALHDKAPGSILLLSVFCTVGRQRSESNRSTRKAARSTSDHGWNQARWARKPKATIRWSPN